LSEPGFSLDYVSVVDMGTFQECEKKIELNRPCLVSVAVFVAGVRLIDNLIVGN